MIKQISIKSRGDGFYDVIVDGVSISGWVSDVEVSISSGCKPQIKAKLVAELIDIETEAKINDIWKWEK